MDDRRILHHQRLAADRLFGCPRPLAVAGGSLALASVLVWRDHRRDGQSIRAACVYLVMGLTCVGLFAVSLMLPSAALPGLRERVALLIGAAWIAGFALGAFPQRPCWSPPS